MPATKPFPEPANARPLTDEADIGSGEKTPAQIETEELIRQIPPLPPSRQDDNADEAGTAASQFDAGQAHERDEHAASLERDEPGEALDRLDPVPPKGH